MYKNKELVLSGETVRCPGGLIVEKGFKLGKTITVSVINAENLNAGDITATGNTNVKNITVDEGMTVNGDATVDGTMTVDNIQINNAIIQPDLNVGINNLTVAGALTAGSSSVADLDIAGPLSAGNTLVSNLTADSAVLGILSVPGETSTNTLNVVGNATVTGDLSVSNITAESINVPNYEIEMQQANQGYRYFIIPKAWFTGKILNIFINSRFAGLGMRATTQVAGGLYDPVFWVSSDANDLARISTQTIINGLYTRVALQGKSSAFTFIRVYFNGVTGFVEWSTNHEVDNIRYRGQHRLLADTEDLYFITERTDADFGEINIFHG